MFALVFQVWSLMSSETVNVLYVQTVNKLTNIMFALVSKASSWQVQTAVWSLLQSVILISILTKLKTYAFQFKSHVMMDINN
jgi:hypothetical protein